MRSWPALFILGSIACSGAHLAPGSADSPPPAHAAASAWLTSLDRDNPLVGKIWDAKAKSFVDTGTLTGRLVAARFVFLGERHDNPDHHRLQALLVSEMVKAGRRPHVVFEMLELEQQAEVDRYLATSTATAAGFGAALGWGQTHWPPFNEYQPIFEAAFAGGLPILAGNLAQAEAKALVKHGLAGLPGPRVQQLQLERALPPALELSLRDELRASHCGRLPEELLQPMALAQRARDAQMARVLLSAGAAGGVLIAGAGHARLDRGVPYHVALDSPAASMSSVAFREVSHGETEAEGYLVDEGPFDYVWFTPRGSDDDPCAAFNR